MTNYDIHFTQLVKDFEVSLKKVKRIKYDSDQLYIDACTHLYEIYKNEISIFIEKKDGKEHLDKVRSSYYTYDSQFHLLLEKHVEDFLS